MNINKIKAGNDLPNEVNTIIEIPSHASPIKYEIDKDSSAIWVDRFINVPMYYPANYGFIPHTLSEDGDPIDILVISPTPLLVGCVLACRPIGVLDMEDESGRDIKLIAVPAKKMNSGYDNVDSVDDLDPNLKQQIEHFFENYKKLETDKWVKITGWCGKDQALSEILASIERYKKHS